MTDKVLIDFSGDALLDIDMVWPDGGAPKNPTVSDVIAKMKGDSASKLRLLIDWNLEDDLTIMVTMAGSGTEEFEP